MWGRPAAAVFALCAVAQGAKASSLDFCGADPSPGAPVQDRLLQFAARVKEVLNQSNQTVALVARSGLALQRLGQRYSHAGVSLKAHPSTPWSVRQLYFSCDEQRPRIFDQGIAGFVLGSHDASLGYLSIVFLPATSLSEPADAPPALALERTALEERIALSLLGGTYSANAYAFSTTYQNCNQWLAELLATAWGGLNDAADPRGAAQQWLRTQGYQPTAIQVRWQPLMWLARHMQWLHSDDHPPVDLQAAQFQVSMPQSIEAFARQRYAQTERIEMCYTRTHIVLRHGWKPIADGCEPEPGDEVTPIVDQNSTPMSNMIPRHWPTRPPPVQKENHEQ